MSPIDRRGFMAGAAGVIAGSTLSQQTASAANRSNGKIVLALMGVNNRGTQLAERFNKIENVEIAYVCDCDERQIGKGIKAIDTAGYTVQPQGIADFREALDDPQVDGLICAAPNHWHAAATITACQAGKHVYVEKPCSHSAEEGERMIAAAQQAERVVQVGMQRRSGGLYQRVVKRVQAGAIGEVLMGKSYYYRNRPSVGHASPTPPPAWLDYDMWQGPTTQQAYRSNILHYNWHQFSHWGDGEIGNNGVHTIDICRWAMGIDFPDRVDVYGAKLRYDDDADTPDTMTANFSCGDKLITWEGVSWSDPYKAGGQIGIELRGDQGTLFVNDDGYTIYGLDRKPQEQETGSRGDVEHCQDFADRIRAGGVTNGALTEGHRSALFCHLANIAHRSGESLSIDPRNGHLVNVGPAAASLWSRAYRDKWMPTV